MKQYLPERPLSDKRKKKDKSINKKPNFIKTFLLTFWVTSTSTEFLMWITDGLFTWAINKAVTRVATSVIASAVVLVIRIIFYQTKPTRSKFMEKISQFLKRVGAYLKSNKRTAGGILTSVISGASTLTITILGYTVNLTDVVSQIQGLAWVQNVQIAGFDVMPLIVLIVGGLFCVWNAIAAVSRGWETPENYEEKQAEIAEAKAEEKRIKAEKEAEKKAKAEAEAEIERARIEAEALIAKEQADKEKAEQEALEAVEKAKAEAEEKAREEEHRKLVEKYKAEFLAKQNAENN